LNAGGSAGKGSGQRVQVPEMPGLVGKNGGAVGPVELAEVGQRGNLDPVAQKNAFKKGKALTAICEDCGDGSEDA